MKYLLNLLVKYMLDYDLSINRCSKFTYKNHNKHTNETNNSTHLSPDLPECFRNITIHKLGTYTTAFSMDTDRNKNLCRSVGQIHRSCLFARIKLCTNRKTPSLDLTAFIIRNQFNPIRIIHKHLAVLLCAYLLWAKSCTLQSKWEPVSKIVLLLRTMDAARNSRFIYQYQSGLRFYRIVCMRVYVCSFEQNNYISCLRGLD